MSVLLVLRPSMFVHWLQPGHGRSSMQPPLVSSHLEGHGVQREPWPGEALVQTSAKGVRVWGCGLDWNLRSSQKPVLCWRFEPKQLFILSPVFHLQVGIFVKQSTDSCLDWLTRVSVPSMFVSFPFSDLPDTALAAPLSAGELVLQGA